MKHIRAVTTDQKHVVHSLRHNMQDSLVLAEVTALDRKLILGHAVEGVGDAVRGTTGNNLFIPEPDPLAYRSAKSFG